MRRIFVLISLLSLTILFSFEMNGDPKMWSRESLVNFDSIGDGLSYTGDISSVFAFTEDDKLFLRITFDDMYSRKNNIDYFVNQNIDIDLLISSSAKTLFRNTFDINNILKKDTSLSFLRTPEFNLLEIEINWPYSNMIEDLFFDIKVIHNENIVDRFSSSISDDYRGGNVAFVHHGNQGLTYSEVFYGQEPLESSGFEEILEFHQ